MTLGNSSSSDGILTDSNSAKLSTGLDWEFSITSSLTLRFVFVSLQVSDKQELSVLAFPPVKN